MVEYNYDGFHMNSLKICIFMGHSSLLVFVYIGVYGNAPMRHNRNVSMEGNVLFGSPSPLIHRLAHCRLTI